MPPTTAASAVAAASRRAPPPPLSPPAIFFGHSAARSFAHAPAPPLGNFPPPDRAAFCSFFPSFLHQSLILFRPAIAMPGGAALAASCIEDGAAAAADAQGATASDTAALTAPPPLPPPTQRGGGEVISLARTTTSSSFAAARSLARSPNMRPSPLLCSTLPSPNPTYPRGEGGRQVTLIARCVVGRRGAKGKEEG